MLPTCVQRNDGFVYSRVGLSSENLCLFFLMICFFLIRKKQTGAFGIQTETIYITHGVKISFVCSLIKLNSVVYVQSDVLH